MDSYRDNHYTWEQEHEQENEKEHEQEHEHKHEHEHLHIQFTINDINIHGNWTNMKIRIKEDKKRTKT